MAVRLDDIRDHVASLFIMLNKATVILFRIEFLVVLVTLVFFAMFLMDFYRRIIHNSFMRAVFSVFDAVSDSIVVYLLGAMQTAPFKNQLFPVWALVLVNFRYSADYISGYGVPDRRGRRFTEWNNVFKLLGSAFLNWTRGSSLGPLWLVWVLQIERSFYRFFSHKLASGTFWHGRSSELVAEHMRSIHERGDQASSSSGSNNSGRELFKFNPDTMEGYRYLVYGETKQQQQGFKLKKPQYALSTPSPLITLHKIWNPIIDVQQEVAKDLPLAFALSRLLRCRFEDVTLQRCIFDTNRDLVKSIVAGQVGVSDALRIMELQLAFVHDYFNTRYPMVFWCGLPSLFISLLLSVLTIGAAVWLAVDIRKVYKPPSGELANMVKGFNVDAIITWSFILLMIFKEMWEMHTYLRSDWASLIKACEHVQRKLSLGWPNQGIGMRASAEAWMECVVLYFSRSSNKITDRRWHGLIDQYVFVESYDDRPRFWNLIHNLTTGIVPKKDDGAKLRRAIKVPDCVREEVLKQLSELIEGGDGRAGSTSTLPRFITTLSNSNTNLSKELQRYQAYTARPSSATIGGGGDHVALPTASHIILVWHIATSLCEMELATKHGVDLGPCSLLSWFSSLCSSRKYLMDVDDKKGCCNSSMSWFTNCCCSSKPNDKLPAGPLRRSYTIANSLSRYCAYLLVSKPDLIPDSFLVPKIVFQKTVRSARDGIFKDSAGSLQERYRALMDEAEKPITERDEEDVLKQGIALGKELLKHPTKTQVKEEELKHEHVECDIAQEKVRWEILAGVWTELLIHIAPTWNAQAHKKCLSAGEFITHIWALLWHCGIQKSSLWPKETGPENNEPQPQFGIERSQTGGYIMRETDHIGITIDEADDNKGKGTKELGACDSSTSAVTGLLRMEGTGSSEIEEVATIVQKGMAGQAQNERQ